MTPTWHADGPATAPALVLLNSIGTSSALWAACVGPLAERFRVLRVELPGHAGAVTAARAEPLALADLAADVLAVLDEAGVTRAHVAGVSIGAMTAMWLAARHPTRVGRIALLCTTAHPDQQRYRERAAAVRDRGMTAVADVPRRLWFTAALGERDPALAAELEAMQARVDPEGYAQCCDALAGTDLRPELARIAAPALVVGGADDPAAPPDELRAIADGIPGARLVLLDGAAHLAPVERPGAVTRLLLDHLGTATPASGEATRRAVLGDAHVDAAAAATTEFTAAFQEFTTRYAWGDVWSRPGLGRRERSIATLAALVALGAENEIAMHVRAAVRNGLTREEIGELLLHTALYAGLPRANRAFAIARDVLNELPT